jgi:hypothetical protein
MPVMTPPPMAAMKYVMATMRPHFLMTVRRGLHIDRLRFRAADITSGHQQHRCQNHCDHPTRHILLSSNDFA